MTEKKPRGFALMSPERRRELAAKGGHSVPREKRSFSVNPKRASDAGKIGGKSVNPDNRIFSRNRSMAAEAGRKGGKSTQNKKRLRSSTGRAPDFESVGSRFKS